MARISSSQSSGQSVHSAASIAMLLETPTPLLTPLLSPWLTRTPRSRTCLGLRLRSGCAPG